MRRDRFEIRFDTAFADVIEACAEPSPGRRETWINDEIIELFSEVHRLGSAHSVECWRDGGLVGGLYGIALGGAFFAPRAPSLRLSRLDDFSAVHAHRWLIALAAVVGLDRALVATGRDLGMAIEGLRCSTASCLCSAASRSGASPVS